MNDTYKPHITSPYRAKQVRLSPIQEEVEKNIGTFNLTVQVEEDTATVAQFKHVPNFVAFICTLKRGTETLGIGRGSAVLNRLNKYIERSTRYAYCASIVDAIVRSTKMLDALYLQPNEQKDVDIPVKEADRATEPATDAQKSYLQKLIKVNVVDEQKRKYWESQINMLTKDEASEKIQSFVKK
ncbi:MAG: hypothetical protein WDK96_01455 [Candidatus Paceibacterota bacterium]|jgi:hypothetical protein